MWRNIWKTSSSLLTQQQSTILSAAYVIMAMMFLSKLLGLVKLRLLVHYFGDGHTTAAFILASKLPELFFDILISSVLSVSFIPVYTSFIAKGDEEHASRLASTIINLTIITYIVVACLCFIFANQVVQLFLLGSLTQPPDVVNLTVLLVRLMLLAQLFLIVGGYLTAVLQSHQRFLVPAIAMTLYNTSVVVGLLLLSNKIGIFAAIVGMLIGGFMQFIVQVPFLSSMNFRFSLLISPKLQGVMTIIKLAIPRMFGIMSTQIVDALNVILALQISAISVVSLQYATSLAIVPVSLFGAAIGQAALPALTTAWARNQKDHFLKLFFASFNQILFFALPIAAVFIVLRLPVVRLLFGDPKFTWEATVTTGRTLAVFGMGIVAQSLIMLLARTFYAMHDTKTPLKVSITTLAFHVVLAVIAMKLLPNFFHFEVHVWWLAAIFSLTTILNAAVLLVILVKRLGADSLIHALRDTMKLFFCAGVMIIIMYIPLQLMDMYVWEHIHKIGPFDFPSSLQRFILDTRYTVNLIILTATSAVLGGLGYLTLAITLKVEEVRIVTQALQKVKNFRKVLSETDETIEADRQLVR